MDHTLYQTKIGLTRTQRMRSMLQTPNIVPITSTVINSNQNSTQVQSIQQFKSKRFLRNSFSDQPGFCLKDYIFQGSLGKGQFAKVYKGIRKSDGQTVAIKVYEKCYLNQMKKHNIQREINILNSLNHPNIIKLIEVIDNIRGINLIMEYGGDKNLRDYINSTENHIKKLIKQIAKVLNYLQSQSIIHRDLKLDNILINKNEIKVIDFGFATISDGNKISVFCGTPNYMAPEMLLKIVSYSYEVDWWALGIILYYLIESRYPFKGKNELELFTSIKSGVYQKPKNMSDLGFQFLERLLTNNPKRRISPSEILNHKWFTELTEPVIGKYFF